MAWFKAAHTTNFLFFGLCCLAIGYLIVRSRFLPNVFGVLMACAGLAWLVTTFPWLAHTIAPVPVIVGLIGEGALMGYLLVKGLGERPIGFLTGGGRAARGRHGLDGVRALVRGFGGAPGPWCREPGGVADGRGPRRSGVTEAGGALRVAVATSLCPARRHPPTFPVLGDAGDLAEGRGLGLLLR